MKLGIIVTTYNRPKYLKQCLESLQRAELPEGTFIVIVDDASTDAEVDNVIAVFCAKNKWYRFKKFKNEGIKKLIRDGIGVFQEKDYPHKFKFDLIINLDGDAIVRNDFATELIKLHERFPNQLITGFECTNKNPDGSPRHKTIGEGQGFKIRQTVGGINLCFTPKMYNDWILPALNTSGNWDQRACLNAGNGVICASPSLIQHIGLESSMGHSGTGGEMADVSDTFKPLHLPNVTLIGVDTNADRLQMACDISTRDILFGDVKMINNAQIRSKQDYSAFCVKELYKHVKTDFMLIIQWDGYVLNYKAWNPEWLNYDYIGAPWWYRDGMNVGNGGFSLRSKKLMEIVAKDAAFERVFHPEDDVICRQRRRYLETQYGIKFAPEELARQFSIEGYNQSNKTWSNEFGFHGNHIDKSNSKDTNVALIQQFFGIGDVIFSIQIGYNLIKEGYKVIWPVKGDYVEGLNKAYPQITFIDYKKVNVNYDNKIDKVIDGIRMIPLRWTYETQKVPFKDCMRSKYDAMGYDWETWKDAQFVRNAEKETALFKELGLHEGQEYTLVNEIFCTDLTGKRVINAEGHIVKLQPRPGYSLFDWAMVIEKAKTIHTVSTSIIYLLEMLPLKADKVFIYIRKPNERDHENYQYIMTKHVDKYVFETP